MIFSPHSLFIKIDSEPRYDEFGRFLDSEPDKWEKVARCRCDNNTTKFFKTDNGESFQPAFHCVVDGKVKIKEGDMVRCMDGAEVRGEGRVLIVKKSNYFQYTEIWM